MMTQAVTDCCEPASDGAPSAARPSVNYAQRTLNVFDAVSPTRLDPVLARLCALLALTKGEAVSPVDVHNAWALWCTSSEPTHPALVPFGELTDEVCELERPCMEAIRVTARVENPAPRSAPAIVDLTVVNEVVQAAAEFAAVADQINAGVFEGQVEQLRRRELAQVISALDEVRNAVAWLLESLAEQVAQFEVHPAEFDDAVAAISCAGESLYGVVRELDPRTPVMVEAVQGRNR